MTIDVSIAQKNSMDPDPQQPDDEFWNSLTMNVLETFAIPEITRRETEGRLPANFQLVALQVVMEVDAAPEVRLNEEVSVGAYLREGATMPATDTVYNDLREVLHLVDAVGLPPSDHPNAAHITMVLTVDGWSVWFDLRYNAERVKSLLLAARQFFNAAKASVTNGFERPAVSDLFTAVELIAKGRLMLHPDPRLLTTRRHGMTHTEFNRYTAHGNAHPRFADLLNRLSQLRNPARYSSEWNELGPELAALVNTAEDFLRDVESSLPRRARTPLATHSA
jgi:HEPN domain-containing protein